MELVFKIVTTMVTLFFVYLFLSWLWIHQIDVKETFLGSFKKKTEKPVEWISTRNPEVIYQNDKVVGNITNIVREIDGSFIFTEICNTSSFNTNIPFEYKREKLKVNRIGSIIGLYSSVTNQGSEVKHNVMKDVVCERVR